MRKRVRLEDIAKRRHMSVEALITQALEEAGTPYGASVLLGISAPSITNAMRRYGLRLQATFQVIKEGEPS